MFLTFGHPNWSFVDPKSTILAPWESLGILEATKAAPRANQPIQIRSKGSILGVILEFKIDENPIQKRDAKEVGSGAASERILARYWSLGPSSSIGFNGCNQ